MRQSCTVIDVASNNLEESIKNPGLTALISEGWSIAATFALETGDGPERIAMVLAPPNRDHLSRDIRILTLVVAIGFAANIVAKVLL